MSWPFSAMIEYLVLLCLVSSATSQFSSSDDIPISREINKTGADAQSQIANPWHFRAVPGGDFHPSLDISISQEIGLPHLPWGAFDEFLQECQFNFIFNVS